VVRHNTFFKAEDVKARLSNYNDAFKAFQATAETLAQIKLSSEQASSIFNKILVGDAGKANRASTRALALFDGAGIGAEMESAKGTAWGALNAITQLMDWETARTGDARLRNAWFGGGADLKQHAMEELLALA
jgi:hypothetical protein